MKVMFKFKLTKEEQFIFSKEEEEFLNYCFKDQKYKHYKKCRINGGIIVSSGDVIINNMNIKEIPIKFNTVSGDFNCWGNKLTTLKNIPYDIGGDLNIANNSLENIPSHFSLKGRLIIYDNPLTDYFKSIKEEDFPYWDKLLWYQVLREYPFLVNIAKKYTENNFFVDILNHHPITKLYLKD